MLLSRLRKPVDTYAPSVGLLYRSLRDVGIRRAAKATRYGFTLAGDPTMARDDYEVDEANAFLELLDSHEAVIDIGANVGFYSCLAASRGKDVISFEPSARNLKYLYRNLWQNRFHQVEVFPLGLANRTGLMQLYGFGGISSLVRGWAQADEDRFTIIPVTSLDMAIADRFGGRRLLIKIDVEGFELEVLAGARRTLELTPKPTWMLEILLTVETVPGGVNTRFSEAFDLFWSHNYQCRKLNSTLDLVRPEDVRRWTAEGQMDDETRNFLFSVPVQR